MADNDFAEFKSALIVGAGTGLSAALARVLTRAGLKVTLASRTIDDLTALQRETGAQAFACDATKEAEVVNLFASLEHNGGAPDVVVYNASGRSRGPFIDLVPAEVEKAIGMTYFFGAVVAIVSAIRISPVA